MCPSTSLFSRLGGVIQIRRVNKIFYDKIYADDWMSQFFLKIDQERIESQQTDFMVKVTGGPAAYYGAMPIPAHSHMMITEELFTYRAQLLKESLQEAGIPAGPAGELMAMDEAFRGRLVKKGLADCKGRFRTDPILDFKRPPGRRAG